ncbi:MAG: T9SS type A sorting domain-containing protein, partial [Bacteroidota bacterium]
ECELTSATAMLNVINTGTDDRSIQHRMDVFPNPAINYLYIPENLIYGTVTIAELTGRIIETYSNIENAKLSVEQLVPGMYVITATDKSGKYVARFIKN